MIAHVIEEHDTPAVMSATIGGLRKSVFSTQSLRQLRVATIELLGDVLYAVRAEVL
jgi:hypothetical protein